ncbi:YihY/virulence factor BrkB family protein [Microbacterium sp. EYE_5]|uniref:YihY/virulence factor BrkB family protein n=1 Tax=unclassified Microbacterium TaxID=2609290 RepID=UPI0020055DA4|nr:MULTISPECIES: YihY/virulence factor BrkB family protein [unclassified Microbacterium]MCK6080415.1 YihY/virulence factor BrkB family protein [Microbacterium sp. EYE_382]MCK6085686.1 YihY/virulence factor BrkB family protein [Microbacterium sp. EYE_384]MCK6124816.1 YihY/virulence factor BrkB family protein [Microbacterium sp. EYE_80]MCK6127725.1 YihY/virulence factor BrkB family protein [Microbacterium sp. EYE_79]MCK6141370.1 YihY/virulence factor BrkB family protein [Microbacterium sp. EYE_3
MAEKSQKQPPIARLVAWALEKRIVRAYLRYTERRGALLADSVTYRTLFSVFAGVLLGFSVAALWLGNNPQAWAALIDAVDSVIPGLFGTGGLINAEQLRQPLALSFAGIFSLIGLIVAAIGAIGSLRTALRVLADKVHDDTFFLLVMARNLLLAIGIGAGLGAAAAATILGTAGVGIVADLFGVSADDPLTIGVSATVGILVTFLLDTVAVAGLFLALSGVRPPARVLWTGAVIGGVGLTVLQQLSSLFVGGASSNPLLASFASLIALLLWINLSCQVILIASSYIIAGTLEHEDRVRAVHGARTMIERRVQTAEDQVRAATDELRAAREALAAERDPS